MLYLIGGPPRIGKSTMAQTLLSDLGIPYVSTDTLTVMLKPVGQPSFYSPKKSERFFPYLDLFISRILPVDPDYAIEGDALSPDHVKRLEAKYDLRSIFLTMSDITTEGITANVKHDDWSNSVTTEHLEGLVQRIKLASSHTQSECQRLNINCYDLSGDYNHEFRKHIGHYSVIKHRQL